MTIRKTEVGDVLNIWSASTGKHASTAVITAHGGDAYVNGMDKAPDYTLAYYSDHGHILSDPSIMYILTGRSIPCQTIQSRASQDYELTKYTNTSATVTGSRQHNTGGESYDSIRSLEQEFSKGLARQRGSGSAQEQVYLAGMKMDVITIRDRKFYASPKLSDVLKILDKHKYRYTTLHCSFCRGGGQAQAPKSNW
ncbi:putative adhesin [Roseisolibacter sp. H3M3-2]|uniref:putative adhesin n=1 Tax=Roseisolibacter sp. H3M3-2 TaxID=3031323 RepID=UPI0023DA681A|nr:hypothetical protein [Roseisolibacter sp. H3M3-2]MDF1505169.1 hypothetical protein [Roseisolibacter sp. H3M3-2]